MAGYDPFQGSQQLWEMWQQNKQFQDQMALRNREMALREQAAQRENTLRDLIIKQKQDEETGRQQLVSRLSDLKPYDVTGGGRPATFLDSIQPMGENAFGVANVSPTRTVQQPTLMDKADIMADEAASGNPYAMDNIQNATNIINLSDNMAKRRAEASAYGDTETAFKIDAELGKITKGTTMLSQVNKTMGRQGVLALVKRFPEVFKGIDPALIQNGGNGVMSYPVDQNGVKGIVYWHTDKPESVHFAAAGNNKPYNIPNDVESFLATKYDTSTPEGSQQALAWFRTPEGNKAWLDYKRQVKESTYIQPPPTYLVLGSNPVTGNPIVINNRGEIAPKEVPTGPLTPKTQTPLTPEAAAKAQLVEQGLSYMPEIRKGFIGEDGKSVDRINVAANAVRAPFTEGRRLNTLILDAVEAKLRAESGAAVPDTEVKRSAKRFIPQVADDDKTIKTKLDNLEAFLKGTSQKINTGRPLNNGGGKKGKPSRPALSEIFK